MLSPSSTKAGAAIYKCNQCDFIAENKYDIGQHLAATHPQCTDSDYSVISANANSRWNADEMTPDKDDDVKSERMDAENSEDDFNMSANEIENADHMNADGSNEFTVLCPLCQDPFTDKKSLEKHVMTIHSVTNDGVARLLNTLVDTSQWLNSNNGNNSIGGNSSMVAASNKIGKSPGSSASSCADSSDMECVTCGTSFKSTSELYTREFISCPPIFFLQPKYYH